MDLSFIPNTISAHILTPVIGGVISVVAWQLGILVWERLKPMSVPREFLRRKAFSVGIKSREFLNKRIKDAAFRAKVEGEYKEAWAEVYDSFVDGLEGRDLD